jgi:hypothetical protein
LHRLRFHKKTDIPNNPLKNNPVSSNKLSIIEDVKDLRHDLTNKQSKAISKCVASLYTRLPDKDKIPMHELGRKKLKVVKKEYGEDRVEISYRLIMIYTRQCMFRSGATLDNPLHELKKDV